MTGPQPEAVRGDDPAHGPAAYEALRRETQQAILKAFVVKPWHIGLAPVPRRIRIWHKLTFWRWRTIRRYRRKAKGEPIVLEDW